MAQQSHGSVLRLLHALPASADVDMTDEYMVGELPEEVEELL